MTSSEVKPAGLPLLVMRGIRKEFDGVEVLRGIDLDVYAGEVHALVGENGAGKSTLMNILAGVHQPTAGSIAWDQQLNVVIADERAAQRLGISIVFQERSLFPDLSVAENVYAARQPSKFGRINRRQLDSDATAWLRRVGLTISPKTLAEALSPAEQQLVEVAKALSLKARLIIFDEPTSSLTERETRALFAMIRQLQQDGIGVIYISHRLEEIFEIADRITVLKDGTYQGTDSAAEATPESLVRRMVGRSLTPRTHEAGTTQAGSLEVIDWSDPPDYPKALLRQVNLRAQAGEIVGLAGLAGAGRTELALAIFGVRPRGSGEIRLNGRTRRFSSPGQAIAAGLGYAFEDRKEGGLFLEMTVAENMSVARLRDFGSWFLDRRREAKVAGDYIRSLRIVTRGSQQLVLSLSGGNQQKVVLAKWFIANPGVLIVDEPTRGVDVGAKAEIHQFLYDLSRRGSAVVVISSDLPEILAVSDRIYVMREGRITGELARTHATEEGVMRLASLPLAPIDNE